MLIRTTFILLLLFCFLAGNAQVVSNKGLFTFPDSKACAPYGSSGEIVVSVPTCPDNNITTCAIDFRYDPTKPFGTSGTEHVRLVKDGVPMTPAYTYTEPGTYLVAILFGDGEIDYAPFTVLPGTPPDFNIYTCSNNAVQVDLIDTRHDQYTVDYDEDNVPDVTAPPGLVSPPRNYIAGTTQATIGIRSDYRNCPVSAKTVDLIGGSIDNSFYIQRLEVTNADEIALQFNNIQPNVLYSLERDINGNGSFTEVIRTSNQSAFTDPSVSPDQSFYSYRLGAVDICNSPIPTYSPTIRSIINNITVNDGSIDVNWITNSGSASTLEVLKNASPIALPLANSGTYNDAMVTCGTEYCYQIVMRYAGAESISKLKCGTARSTAQPPAIDETSTIVNGNEITIEWVAPENYTIPVFDLFRYPDNISFPLANVTSPSYTDGNYSPFEGICYQLRYDDACRNRSGRSIQVCPIDLTATLREEDNAVVLTWTSYWGYGSGVNRYVVEKYSRDGLLVESVDVTGQNGYTDMTQTAEQIFTYRILAYSNSPDVTGPSISNTQTVIRSPRLWNPTAFAPESTVQGNNTFSVRGIPDYITAYELRIFNRWGELMFYSNDMENGWDGSYKGVKMPEGTYIFKVRIIDTAGRTIDHSGSFILLKK
jgi:gliding motility-associated-like protein